MEDQYGQIYFIDYGIAKSISSKKKRSYKKRGFIGTPRYGSVQAHLGEDQTAKDDLESLFYVLAHFYFKILPWMKLPQTNSRLDNILNLKLEKSDSLFMRIGPNFLKCFRYIR